MKKRVVIVTWFYQSQPGFLDFKYRIRALARTHDVTLVLRHDDFRAEFEGLPLKMVVIPTAGTKTLELLAFMWRAASAIRSWSPDLVVLLGSQVAITARLLGRVPSVLYWNEHPTHFFDQTPRNPFKLWLSKTLLALNYRWARCATTVMPIGEAHAEDLLAHGVPASQVRLIYMGVESRFADIARPAASPDAIRMIYTGTVLKERGRDVMLDAVALARDSGVRVELTMVGAIGSEQAYCIARAAELGIDDRVNIVGRVPGERIPEFLAQADVGICIWEDRPWWRFNPPTKLFEYLVAGLPVLGSRIRTHTDYVHDWSNGLVFDYGASALHEALMALHRRRDELPALSSRARAGARRYLWTAIEPEFLATCDAAVRAVSHLAAVADSD